MAKQSVPNNKRNAKACRRGKPIYYDEKKQRSHFGLRPLQLTNSANKRQACVVAAVKSWNGRFGMVRQYQ